MLLLIETNSRTCITKIEDSTYNSIAKAFEMIDHPEFNLAIKENESLSIGREYNLYDWDDIATIMTEQNKSSIFDINLDDVEFIGYVKIIEDDYVWIKGEVEE